MNIYTKTGDQGTTGLFGGQRVSKSDLRLEAYGTIDELTADLGLVHALASEKKIAEEILQLIPDIQSHLMIVASHLATPYTLDTIPATLPTIPTDATSVLEHAIDQMEATLPPLKNFILPGGSSVGASVHVARTVCRRAERAVIRLSNEADVLQSSIVYLNRLSDYLFVLARFVNMKMGEQEEIWKASL